MTRILTKKGLGACTLVAGLLLACGTADAASVDFYDEDTVLRIRSVEIAGTLWDVDFINDPLPSSAETVFDTPESAESAADAINAVLNAYPVNSVAARDEGGTIDINGKYSVLLSTSVGPGRGGFPQRFYEIWKSIYPDLDGSPRWVKWNYFANDPDFLAKPFATFTQTVPLPGAVWLFGTALGFVGWVGYRRSRTQA